MDGATGLILGMSWGVLLGFIVLGIGVGAFGTLIGAGGGLIFVPVFLYLFTDWSPAMVVGTSLTIVMFNAMSASTAFIKQKKNTLQCGNLVYAGYDSRILSWRCRVGRLRHIHVEILVRFIPTLHVDVYRL